MHPQHPAIKAFKKYDQFAVYETILSKEDTFHIIIDYQTGGPGDGDDRRILTSYSKAKTAAARLGEGFGVAFKLTNNDPFFILLVNNCNLQTPGVGLQIIGSYKGAAPRHTNRNEEHDLELYTSEVFIGLPSSSTQHSGTVNQN